MGYVRGAGQGDHRVRREGALPRISRPVEQVMMDMQRLGMRLVGCAIAVIECCREGSVSIVGVRTEMGNA